MSEQRSVDEWQMVLSVIRSPLSPRLLVPCGDCSLQAQCSAVRGPACTQQWELQRGEMLDRWPCPQSLPLNEKAYWEVCSIRAGPGP